MFGDCSAVFVGFTTFSFVSTSCSELQSRCCRLADRSASSSAPRLDSRLIKRTFITSGSCDTSETDTDQAASVLGVGEGGWGLEAAGGPEVREEQRVMYGIRLTHGLPPPPSTDPPPPHPSSRQGPLSTGEHLDPLHPLRTCQASVDYGN
uniref:Uncharacterized protein n=1 Tax=Knipowitschia caucasica TaxID=637954 RepID=A0AAV2IYA3_KNICA